MTSPVISFKPRGLKEFKDFISGLERNMRGTASEAVATYIIGNGYHGLKHYPRYRYISRAKAYGNVSRDGAPAGYFSWRQFRKVMVLIKDKEPGFPHRTGNIQRGWVITGKGVSTTIANNAPGVKYVMGTGTQAAQPKRAGWRTVAEIVQSNIKGAVLAAERAVIAKAKAK